MFCPLFSSVSIEHAFCVDFIHINTGIGHFMPIMWVCCSSLFQYLVLYYVCLSSFIMWVCHSSLCGSVILHYVSLSFIMSV